MKQIKLTQEQKDRVQYLVYTPSINPWHCRGSVYEDYGVGYRQCKKNPTMVVGEVKVCKTHAKYLCKRLGIEFND